jgi:DNA-binding XRE family transcriptional regulator
MNKPVHTTTPSGEQIVILSAREYARLVRLAEDAEDIARAETALKRIEAGEAEILSEAEVRELLEARTPISFWRKRRGFTQAVLAKRVGISQAYLAQIERGKRTGDIQLYQALGHVLGVNMEDIVPPAEAAPETPPTGKARPRPRQRSRTAQRS